MAQVQEDNEKYECLEVIGRGAFGIIRKVRRKADGYILCRKEINYLKMSQKERDQLSAELSILSSLKHEHIVGYYHREHLKSSQELYIYMEYCGGGDLGQVIKNLKNTGKVATEEFVWRVFGQLVEALYKCHYGVDAPEPGSDVFNQKDPRKTLEARVSKMILHRDLKPENVFLNQDQHVKLGDFGLSKLMQSHDFASTYVGTPYYMSPEICMSEKYTLQSDIWAVGCIIYELCTHNPPFDANTHLQLIQKIRKGDFAPLPACYSKELAAVVASCLKTNPHHRPDTHSLLTMPYVWVTRKTDEIVRLGSALKSREDTAEQKVKQSEERLAALEADRDTMRADIEAQLRREWELKARLEINRQVQVEVERLHKEFDAQVEKRVTEVLAQRAAESRPHSRALREIHNPLVQPRVKEYLNPQSSVTTASGDEDFPSSTDLTSLSDLSLDSPADSTSKPMPPKKSRTAFARSKTTFDSPADIQMSEPSPMSISSLALSPRRTAAAQEKANLLPGKNIFTDAARAKRNWEPTLAYTTDGSDDEQFEDSDDDIPDLPSPSRPSIPSSKPAAAAGDPFKMPVPSMPSRARPGLMRQKTTGTCQRLGNDKPTLFPVANTGSSAAQQVRAGMVSTTSVLHRGANDTYVAKSTATTATTSPTRTTKGLSKIPSRPDLLSTDTTGLSRSPSRKGNVPGTNNTQLKSKMAGGRTLVELAQARAGGRAINSDFQGAGQQVRNTLMIQKDLLEVPVYDPDILGDEMPSPFLKKYQDIKIMRGIR